MPEDTITISKEEYADLLRDSKFLQCLEDAGVDNWNGYEHACQAMGELEEDEDPFCSTERLADEADMNYYREAQRQA